MTLQIQNKTRQGVIGTAAAIVCFADKPDEPYLLSASHVMAATQNASVGDAIVAVTATGSVAAGGIIATLFNWTGLIDGAGFPNLADAAIARLSAGLDPATAFPGLVNLTFAQTRANAGAVLTSLSPSGAGGPVRSSSEDCVIAWKDPVGSGVWDYGMADHILGAFPVADGDSGAPVLNASGEIVGIISGAPKPGTTDSDNTSVISAIDNIMDHAQWNPRTLVAYAERHTTLLPEIRVTARPATPAAFIAAHKDDALNVKRKYRVPASVCLAQSAIETGWGRRVVGNAFFGVKSTSATGNSVKFGTHEQVDGRLVPTMGTFRAYQNFADAADDYGKLLSTAPRYRPAFDHPNDPVEFGRAIARAGYATSEDYESLLVSVLRSRNLLALDPV